MPAPTTKTWAVDASVSAAEFNTYIRDPVEWFGTAKPSCQASRTSQSIADTTSTAASFTAEAWDTASMHSNVTNPSRITIPSGGDGRYHIVGRAAFEHDAEGQNRLEIRVNGVVIDADIRRTPGASSGFNVTCLCDTYQRLSGGQYVELWLYHNTGTTRTVTSKLSVEWVGL